MLFLCPNSGNAADVFKEGAHTHRAHLYPTYTIIHTYPHTYIDMYISTEHPHEHSRHQHPPSLSG